MLNGRFACLSLLIILLLASNRIEAESRRRIAAFNVGLQPALTLASAAIQGKLRTRGDWWRCIRAGAIAGGGFYEAKVLDGNGHTRAALATASLASSITRNAAAGRPELARVGMPIGPLWLDASTPFDKDPVAPLHLQTSVAELVAFALERQENDRIVFRDGLIAFRKSGRYEHDRRRFTGYTFGVFPGTSDDATQKTWHHETVHVIESMQADSVEPPACAWLRRCNPLRRKFGILTWEPLQLGVLPASGGLLLSKQDYPERFTEIEATWLAERRAPR
ncbi:MAG: hypothetical protein JOZ54_12365 [Acidobacteria bacterium]|nr:hypothetical protein [Acidobacteriota bacterium]